MMALEISSLQQTVDQRNSIEITWEGGLRDEDAQEHGELK
jgi:hypothetical protein